MQKSTAIDELVSRRIIQSEAERRDLTVNEEELKTNFEKQLDTMGRDRALQEFEAMGIEPEDLKEESRRSQLFNMVIDAIKSELPELPEITDEDVRSYYDENVDARFTAVEVAHILISAQQGMEESEVEQARQKAVDLIKQINDGADFAELARQHSADPGSAQNGGAYPPTPRGRWVKPFEDAAFTLRPGEMTQEPVKTQFGFHIIKTLTRYVQTFEDVEEQIRQTLPKMRIDEQVGEYLANLRENAGVEISFGESEE